MTERGAPVGEHVPCVECEKRGLDTHAEHFAGERAEALRTTVYRAIYHGDDLNAGQAQRATDRVLAVLPWAVVPTEVRNLAQAYLDNGSSKPEWRNLYRFILTLPCEPEPEWAQAAREAGWTPPVGRSVS